MKSTVTLSVAQGNQDDKKKYEPPKLAFYGEVAKLTRGGAGNGNDGGGVHTKTCWIAEAIYGVDAPRTHLVRAWLSECYEQSERWSLVIVPLYRRYGQFIAAALRRYPVFKLVFRPLFDLAVRRAHCEFAAVLVAKRAIA